MEVSVVVPTTRPQLLGDALQSIEKQTYLPFETLISDNSDDGCFAEAEASNLRSLRVYRPESYLDVCSSWDYAVSKAEGEWVVILCDDDILVPCALSVLCDLTKSFPNVEAIRWQHVEFADNSVLGNSFVPAIEFFDSAMLRQGMFESGSGKFGLKQILPTFPLLAVKKSVLNRVRAKTGGKLFFPLCPMTSGAFGILECTKSVCVINLPLTVLRFTQDSASNITVNPSVALKMQGGTEIIYAPIKSKSIFPAGSLEALLRCSEAVNSPMKSHLDMSRFFLHCNYFISLHDKQGEKQYLSWNEFDRALSVQPIKVRMKYYVYVVLYLGSLLMPMRYFRLVFRKIKKSLQTGGAHTVGIELNSLDDATHGEVVRFSDSLNTALLFAWRVPPYCSNPSVVGMRKLRTLRLSWLFRYPVDFCLTIRLR